MVSRNNYRRFTTGMSALGGRQDRACGRAKPCLTAGNTHPDGTCPPVNWANYSPLPLSL